MLRAESVVSDWSQWNAGLHEKPEIVRQLEGGYSNRSYLLKSAGQQLVLRFNGSPSLLPASNRYSETDIWQAASVAGLSPPLFYTDPQRGILVSAYIEDTLPPRPERSNKIIAQAFKLLKGCHQLDVAANTLDYGRHIQQYWQLIEARGSPVDRQLLRQRQPMQDLLVTLHAIGADTALCHHDPVIANFVGGADRLYLIDWEYAARGLVVMDYAALGIEWGIDDAQLAAKSGIDTELLAMAKELYRYLCALWGEVKTKA